ncbi:hypothetical protein DID80_02210 [Candidatus Marinamargulisbacteria bacterium SCGC AAA071-K20]|nr:hypothetical protein DID80_02210 [Candidatus Marinamargulisbacteria bacterium SCGC AAA071-K20]
MKKNNLYTQNFYQGTTINNSLSSEIIIKELMKSINPNSVLDAGCALGTWLHHWALNGVDTKYVNKEDLVIDPQFFMTKKLDSHFDIGKQFDLVQCLEVAEHIPTQASSIIVENLVRHGKVILFSAAVPGQGGIGHINEQPLAFWFSIFNKHNYICIDFIRPLIKNKLNVQYYYRYNTLLFVHRDYLTNLPSHLLDCIVEDASKLKDYSPLPFKFRKLLLRTLPVKLVDRLASVKQKLNSK